MRVKHRNGLWVWVDRLGWWALNQPWIIQQAKWGTGKGRP